MDERPPVPIEDPPSPPLYELQQRDIPLPSIPVRIDNPVQVRRMPNKGGPAFVTTLTAGTPEHILGADLRRARVTLIGYPTADESQDVLWYYMSGRTGQRCPIASYTPLVLEHCDEIWAQGQLSSNGMDLVAIVELYAD